MTPTTTDAAQEPTYTLERDIARARREMGEFLNSESEPTYTLDCQIAEARREMGPQKWIILNKEWEDAE